jgi:opacity protein-like surface antigen
MAVPDSLSGAGVEVDVDGDFDIYRGTVSLYYDFDNVSRFTPYFGGGLGAAYIDVEDTTFANNLTVEGESDTYFTAHGEAGLAIAATDQIAIVPAYRFIWLDDGEDGFDDDTAHLLKMGLRFRF